MGPRSSFAGLTLQVESGPDFAFDSLVAWPEPHNAEKFLNSVLDGILDELFSQDISFVVTRLRIVLSSIQWHDVDSSQVAFYHAARGAMRQALGFEGSPYNVDLEQLESPDT